MAMLLDSFKELFFDLLNEVLIQEGYNGDYAIVSPANAGEVGTSKPDGFTVLLSGTGSITVFDIERGQRMHEKEYGLLDGATELMKRVALSRQEYLELQEAFIKKLLENNIKL